jgi:spore coat polysaccharide biosynthesis protein SpsF (cytidylyltransferase family)
LNFLFWRNNDEVVKRIIKDKVVLNRCDSQDESDVGGSTEENGTAVKSSKGHDAVSRFVIDIDLDKRINSTDCGIRNWYISMCMSFTC